MDIATLVALKKMGNKNKFHKGDLVRCAVPIYSRDPKKYAYGIVLNVGDDEKRRGLNKFVAKIYWNDGKQYPLVLGWSHYDKAEVIGKVKRQ